MYYMFMCVHMCALHRHVCIVYVHMYVCIYVCACVCESSGTCRSYCLMSPELSYRRVNSLRVSGAGHSGVDMFCHGAVYIRTVDVASVH